MSYDDEIGRMRERMYDDDGSFPDMWDPQPDQMLVGEVLGYTDTETKYGPCQIAQIEEDGTGDVFSVFLSRSVLKNEFERQAPRVGDVVGIKYFGKRPTRDGKSEFHLYKVRVVRKSGIYDQLAADNVRREPPAGPTPMSNGPAHRETAPAAPARPANPGRPLTDDDPPF